MKGLAIKLYPGAKTTFAYPMIVELKAGCNEAAKDSRARTIFINLDSILIRFVCLLCLRPSFRYMTVRGCCARSVGKRLHSARDGGRSKEATGRGGFYPRRN